MIPRPLLALAIASIATTIAAGQSWTQLLPTTSPSARNRAEMVALPSGNVLLHGGRPAGGSSFSDTWEWSSLTGTWTLLSPSTVPTPTCGQGMAYDAARNRVVMHAGWTGSIYVTSTWEWDGTDWSSVPTANTPPGRDWAGFEYDPNTQTVLMFGGHDFQEILSNLGPKGDTWSYDGVNWTQLSPATQPTPRQGSPLVHDRNRGTLILFGGSGGPGVGALGDMWEWDGTDWTQLTPNTLPPARQFHSLAWNEQRQKVILYGGNVGGAIAGDTWEWDGLDWKQGAAGPARQFSPLAYDAISGRSLQFGGQTSTSPIADVDDTWNYNPSPSPWTNLGNSLAGAGGSPHLLASGALAGGSTVQVLLKDAAPNTTAHMIIGVSNLSTFFFGGTLVPSPNIVVPLPTGPTGSIGFSTPYPAGVLAGVPIYIQCWVVDASGPLGLTASNAINAVTQ